MGPPQLSECRQSTNDPHTHVSAWCGWGPPQRQRLMAPYSVYDMRWWRCQKARVGSPSGAAVTPRRCYTETLGRSDALFSSHTPQITVLLALCSEGTRLQDLPNSFPPLLSIMRNSKVPHRRRPPGFALCFMCTRKGTAWGHPSPPELMGFCQTSEFSYLIEAQRHAQCAVSRLIRLRKTSRMRT